MTSSQKIQTLFSLISTGGGVDFSFVVALLRVLGVRLAVVDDLTLVLLLETFVVAVARFSEEFVSVRFKARLLELFFSGCTANARSSDMVSFVVVVVPFVFVAGVWNESLSTNF